MLIDHIEADEGRRQAEVETGMIREVRRRPGALMQLRRCTSACFIAACAQLRCAVCCLTPEAQPCPHGAATDAHSQTCMNVPQVDGLVEYFNGLYDEDQAAIEQLQGEVASRDKLIEALRSTGAAAVVTTSPQNTAAAAAKGGTRDAGVGAKASLLSAPLPPVYVDSGGGGGGCWASLLNSCAARPRAWLCWSLLGLALLALIIGLAAGLAPRPRAVPAPEFSYPPIVLPPGASALDLQLAVSRAATVHYVVVPSGGPAAADGASIVAASAGMLRGSPLEVG